MATKELKNIFLSASIPLEERDRKYFETADIIAIRDSIIALVSVILPVHRLIWGGHPSITPIIYHVMKKLELNIQEHLILYQSNFFEYLFPKDNNEFQNIVFTENLGDREVSLQHMRKRIFRENKFDAAVFIGGMEGIEIEFKMFCDFFPKALLLPIASTGAGSKVVYDNFLPDEFKDNRLVKDYGYMNLFQKLLLEKI